MTPLICFLIFFFIVSTGLGIGAIFTSKGLKEDWYENLDKAPWQPPSWLFGIAWSLIAVTYSIYLAYLASSPSLAYKTPFILLFISQLVMSTLWCFSFFYLNDLKLSLTILATTFLTVYMIFIGYRDSFVNKWTNLFALPYLLWLMLAFTLNLWPLALQTKTKVSRGL